MWSFIIGRISVPNQHKNGVCWCKSCPWWSWYLRPCFFIYDVHSDIYHFSIQLVMEEEKYYIFYYIHDFHSKRKISITPDYLKQLLYIEGNTCSSVLHIMRQTFISSTYFSTKPYLVNTWRFGINSYQRTMVNILYRVC